MASPQRDDPPTLMLAGKRVDGPVMRNGLAKAPPSVHKDTRDISERKLEGNVTRQRLEALEKADLIRIDRGATRKALRRLELEFDEFLDDVPASCAKVPIVKILTWLPNIKLRTAQRIIGTLPIELEENTPVSELPARAKYALSASVERRISAYRRSKYAPAAVTA